MELIYNTAENTLFVGQTIEVGTRLVDDNGCECRLKELNQIGGLLEYPDGSTGEIDLEELAAMRKDTSTIDFELRCI